MIAPTSSAIAIVRPSDEIKKHNALLSSLLPPRSADARREQIDLSRFYNALLTDSWHFQTHTGLDLAELPSGLQTFAGTQFDVRGIVQVNGKILPTLRPGYPREVKSIPIGRACRRLFFLMGTGWIESYGKDIAHVVLHYGDGGAATLRIQYGSDLIDWATLGQPEPRSPETALAWSGLNQEVRRDNKNSGNNLRMHLYKITRANPRPGNVIKSIDLVSTMSDCAPFFLAITVE